MLFDACASVGIYTLRDLPRDPLKDHSDRKISILPGMLGRERLHDLATEPRRLNNHSRTCFSTHAPLWVSTPCVTYHAIHQRIIRAYAFDACASVGIYPRRDLPRDPLRDHSDRKISILPGMFGRERLHVLATEPR